MAVIVEVANEWSRTARIQQPPLDLWHRAGRILVVDRHPHELGPSLDQLEALGGGCFYIGRVGHRHRLHGDRYAAANLNVTDTHSHGAMRMCTRHGLLGPRKAAL